MNNEASGNKQPLNSRNIRITGRSFDPNSPRYNFNGRSGRDISDIKRVGQEIDVPKPPIPEADKVERVEPNMSPANTAKIEDDIDSLFPLKPLIPSKYQKETTKPTLSNKNLNWLLPLLIVVIDLALLAFSTLNKARFHHEYTFLLGLNVILAFFLFIKNSLIKKLYAGLQLLIAAISIGLAIHFSLNYLNTNNIYKQNYQEIKSNSSNLSAKQKINLASYQAYVVVQRTAYINDAKVFYSLMVIETIQAVAFGIVLIKRD